MKFKLRLVALLIAVLMLLTSCELPFLGQKDTTTTTTTTTAKKVTTTQKTDTETKWKRADHSTSSAELKERYTLTQEEVDAAIALLDEMVELSKTAASVDEVDAVYEEFETAFYHIAQQMTIASIIYYCDMSNEEASERHLNTTDMFYDMQDKYMEACRTMYNESIFRDELFADWTEAEIEDLLDYDSATVELRKEIEELQVTYNDLPADEFTDGTAEIYAQIVQKNNELAALYGYDNYYDYATENVYDRDYSKEELASFREYIIEYILPNFNNVYDRYRGINDLSTADKSTAQKFLTGKFDAIGTNYLLEYLDSLEGTMGESMRHIFENKNCVFSGKPNSHPTAFQTYLYEDETPFCLFGSNGQSSTTMVHEIGHYYAALVNNDLSSYDLLETHSQSNEFLFLNYCSHKLNSSVYDVVEGYQLVNACYIIVIATIIDEFEQRVYALDSVEGFTSEDFDAIMDDVCKAYGGTLFVSDNFTDPYSYWRSVAVDNPVYYISYAVSAVAALEIGALAKEDTDAAYTAYTALVEKVTVEDGFIGALEIAGINSPFEEQAFIDIVEMLK